jgi:tripartite motif-containing protein 71
MSVVPTAAAVGIGFEEPLRFELEDFEMQKNYLYAAGSLALAAAFTAVLVVGSEKGWIKGKGAAAPAEAQGLNKPRALAFGPDGSLFIVDSKNNRIEKRNAQGQILLHFGKLGSGDGQLKEPCGIAVGADGMVYVADTFHTLDPNGGLPWGRVEKFSSDGMFAGSWGPVPVDPKDLFGPRAIAIDSKGMLYMSDTGDHRIVKYSSGGSFVKTWGKKGKGIGEFIEPFGVAVDSKDHVYVADRLNFRVQIFDSEGKPLGAFKVDGWEESQINQEPYLAIDSKKGLIYISDPTKGRVLKYSLAGHFIKSYDTALEGKFGQPTGLAWRDSDGLLFVTDGALARVMTLKP